MKWIFGVIFFWLTFVLSLAGWWLYFGITTLSKVGEASLPSQLASHQRMIFMEGCVLMLSLLVGGLALFYFSWRMYKEKSAKEIFFASFTHDLKTALFRMQLELEKLGKKTAEEDIEPIMGHTRKMQLDLENSLDSTVGQNKDLYLEKLSLRDFLLELHAQWPEIRIKLSGEDQIVVDRKALYSIFKNLLHNSFVHGEADEVCVELKKEASHFMLHYSDNGHAFAGDINKLGKITNPSSHGSGFGLYIVRQWVRKMGGSVNFIKNSNHALSVAIKLPGAQ